DMVAGMEAKHADLVLEGGGVKGIALAGAVARLAAAGYSFPRVAGTSAGAITGAGVAAIEAAGESLDQIGRLAHEVDYARFADRGGIAGTIAGHIGPLSALVDVASLFAENGIYEGDYLHDWMLRTLDRFGVRTFGDLKLPPDEGTDLPESHRYRLVVTASDLSRQRFVQLPWDYPDYGLDPDEQVVADAVRMSASIPFVFEPVTLRGAGSGTSTMVDGGVYSTYPITMFDRTDERPPRWPTFGVKLSARPSAQPKPSEIHGPVDLALAIVDAMYGALDEAHLAERCTLVRSIFVDTSEVSPTDFGLSKETQERLYDSGREAAGKFLESWDFEEYIRACRGGPR
ncbi:MAG: patatin-like phospholipase family protein, partial [Streptosporangiaceae bacterium]